MEPMATLEHTTRVAELRAGTEVEGVFACTRKDRLTAKNGSPYLAVERRDLVTARGRVERFRDELQMDLHSIRRAEGADPAAFLPTAYRDLDELDGFLEHLAREVYDPDLRALIDAFFGNKRFRTELRRAPCTRAGHHAYIGGLLEHTVAVATLAIETCVLHPRLNSDLLVSAALLHDLGKTREFALGADIELSDAGALMGHVALGQELINACMADLHGFPPDKRHALLHCVLAHHGPESLPGRRFRTPEALALYRLNALDAGVKAALEHGL